MDREQVYAAIDVERDYQEKVWGEFGTRRVRVPGEGRHLHSVGDWIVFMDHYLTLAKAALSTKEGSGAALDEMRKVVALGVACFEQHGCPKRAGRPAPSLD